MKKQTLQEQVSRIKGMMSLSEQTFGDVDNNMTGSDNSETMGSSDDSETSDSEMPRKPMNPRIYFNNGGSVSIQCNRTTYCEPRNDEGPYSEMELGFPSEGTVIPDELMRYVDGNIDDEDFSPYKSVYGYVPVSIIKMMVAANGGIKTGELPPMVEVEPTTTTN
jgi:hypothetical protein